MIRVITTIVTSFCIGLLIGVILVCVVRLASAIIRRGQRRRSVNTNPRLFEQLRTIADQEFDSWADMDDHLDACQEAMQQLTDDLEYVTDLEEIDRRLDAANEIMTHVDEYLQAEQNIRDWMSVVPTVEPERYLPEHLRRH